MFITSYKTPDLDGTACMIAYAEYLQKTGKEAQPVVFGNPQREAQFVLDSFTIPTPASGEQFIKPEHRVILVDASDTVGISNEIQPSQVVEIIDHRELNEAEKFVNAKTQIELVGSAATLIAEKFYTGEIAITKEAAVLLYAAIISNTVNFHATVTTERDKKMADWLLNHCDIPEAFVHDMFAFKSQVTKPVKEMFQDTLADFLFDDKRIISTQLEMINAEPFVQEKMEEIIIALSELKKEYEATYVFLTCIDVEKALNIFITIDEETKELLEKVLEIHFVNNIAVKQGVLMRKTITPLLKSYIEQKGT